MLFNKRKVLDKGFIRVVDVMGDDSAVVQAARVSYASGTTTVLQDKGLINYLIKHEHWSPFEMCEIKFHIKLPIMIARQWIRHRTANVNEQSGRYSILDNDFYIPEVDEIHKQHRTKKQCSDGGLELIQATTAHKIISDVSDYAYSSYLKLLNLGVSREQARMILGGNIYTQWYWKIDLRNLLHFIKLRIHPLAQEEIRAYAIELMDIVAEWVPYTYEACYKDLNKELHGE